MAVLPPTNLTFHIDSKDLDTVFRTANGGGSGVHTVIPTDGQTFSVWDDELDGITDYALFGGATGAGGSDVAIRITTPLMKHPCVDFRGAATNDTLIANLQPGGGSVKRLSEFVSVGAKTIAFALRPNTITGTATPPALGTSHCLIGNNGFFGCYMRDDGGTKKIYFRNVDASAPVESIEGVIGTGATWIVVFRHGGGNLKLTIIDATAAEVDSTDVPTGNSDFLLNVLTLGKDIGGGGYFDGRLGEMAMWSDEKTGADLTAIKDYFKEQWLTLDTTVIGSTIASGSTLFAPSVLATIEVLLATRASTATLFAPSVQALQIGGSFMGDMAGGIWVD